MYVLAQAMIIGSQHYVTFDGHYFDFAGSCTYLLAKDFVHDTFAILVKYNQDEDDITHKIIVLIGNNAIELDFFNDVSRKVTITLYILHRIINYLLNYILKLYIL